jgi:cytochrome c oxidase cbb3-type subunit 3
MTTTGIALAFLLAASSAADAPVQGKAIANPFAGNAAAIKEGEQIFDARCAECHGGDAMGMSGPDLTDAKWLYGASDAEVFTSVSQGRKGGMPSWRGTLKDDEIWKVIAYIRSLKK